MEVITEMLFFVRKISLFNLYLCCKLQCFSILTQSMPNRCIKKPPHLQAGSCCVLTLVFNVCVQSAVLNIVTSNTLTFCRPFLLEFDLTPLLDCQITFIVGYFIQFRILPPTPFLFCELSFRGLLLKEIVLIIPLELP